MNMCIDRYETTFSWVLPIYPLLSPDLTLAFTKFIPCFCQTLSLFSPNTLLAFVKHSPCFCQTLSLFSPHYLFVLVKPRRGFLRPSRGRYSWCWCKLCAFLFGWHDLISYLCKCDDGKLWLVDEDAILTETIWYFFDTKTIAFYDKKFLLRCDDFYAFFGSCERCSLTKEAMKTLAVSTS